MVRKKKNSRTSIRKIGDRIIAFCAAMFVNLTAITHYRIIADEMNWVFQSTWVQDILIVVYLIGAGFIISALLNIKWL